MSGEVRIVLWVQHLVGVGHQQRAAAVARALAGEGARVRYVSGGLPVAGLDLGGCEHVQLPPARSLDMRYHTLVDECGEPVDDAWRQRRLRALLSAVETFRPHALITETWPFGRGLLRFELEPLMQAAAAARPRPVLISSVRDIVERRREARKYQRMCQRVLDHFHLVLVHGDPALMPFEDSFPLTDRIAQRLRYTGYVSSRPAVARRTRRPDGPVLVSAGGGFFGERLLATAIEAAGQDDHDPRAWHVLVGPNLPESRFEALRRRAGPKVTVERNRADFHQLLDGCSVSVSQAGYNTAVDILGARVPSVMVPYEDDRESEQAVRARHLAARGLVRVVDYATLDAARLRAAVDAAMGDHVMAASAVRLDGARESARIILASVCEGQAASGYRESGQA